MNGLSEFYKTKDRIKKYSRFYMDGDVYVMEIFDIKLKSIDYLISPHTAAKYGPYIIDHLVSKFMQRKEYMDRFNKIDGRLQKINNIPYGIEIFIKGKMKLLKDSESFSDDMFIC